MLKKLWEKIDSKVVEWVIIVIFLIMFYFDWILLERIKVFFIVLFVIWSYIIGLNYIRIYLYNWKEREMKVLNGLKVKEEIKDKKIIRKYKKLVKYLVIFSKIKNSWMKNLINFEIKVFFIFRWMNYKLIKYRGLRLIIIVMIRNFVLAPITLILTLYYRTLYGIKQRTIRELIFRRVEGLILSILIFTNIVNYVEYYVRGKEIIIIYSMLVIVNFILVILYKYVIKTRYEEIVYYFYMTNYWNILNLKKDFLVIEVFLIYLIEILDKMEEKRKEEILGENIILNYFYASVINFSLFRIDIEFKLRMVVGLHKNIDYVLSEIKYKPSLNFYLELCIKFMSFCVFSNFDKVVWGLIKYKDHKEISEKLLRYYEREELFNKYYIYKIWDIERYFEIKENNFIITEELILDLLYFGAECLKIMNIEGAEGKFLDIEANLSYFTSILEEGYYFIKEDYKKFEKLSEELEIDSIIYYGETEKIEMTRKELIKMMERWRKEWEKEWEEGRRNYLLNNLKEDKKIKEWRRVGKELKIKENDKKND
jgi:hypothetical protein